MKILLAIDESPFSSIAIREVAQRPWPEGSQLRLVHAIELLPIVPDGSFPGAAPFYATPIETLEPQRQAAERMLADVEETLSGTGMPIDTVVREGSAAEVILAEAERWPADLIVVGSHGRTGLKRLLLGSVAQKVVAHAPCPVEVVRARTDASDSAHSL